MIYFAQSAKGGKVKIGRSDDPEQRVNSLSSAAGERLKIVATLDASDAVETLLHRALNGPDSFREWHSPSPALDAILEACKAGIDLSPFLETLVEVRTVQKKILVKKPSDKRQMKLTKAERKRRSERMKQLHAEGRAGGRFGSLGGRPKVVKS